MCWKLTNFSKYAFLDNSVIFSFCQFFATLAFFYMMWCIFFDTSDIFGVLLLFFTFLWYFFTCFFNFHICLQFLVFLGVFSVIFDFFVVLFSFTDSFSTLCTFSRSCDIILECFSILFIWFTKSFTFYNCLQSFTF